jgi:hypothetical protein
MNPRPPIRIRVLTWLLAHLPRAIAGGGENSQLYARETVIVVKTSVTPRARQ